jgi:lysine-specific histone demethylase 1
LVGSAANLGDSFSRDDLTSKVMQNLSKIFGADCPAMPAEMILTHWHSDELTYGCLPYIPLGRSDEDYDTLAEPVASSGLEAIPRPYLFFAGDHTHREYPGRLHGAFLSGLREAARIANHFLGPINAPEKQAEYERIGRSYVKECSPGKTNQTSFDKELFSVEIYLSD